MASRNSRGLESRLTLTHGGMALSVTQKSCATHHVLGRQQHCPSGLQIGWHPRTTRSLPCNHGPTDETKDHALRSESLSFASSWRTRTKSKMLQNGWDIERSISPMARIGISESLPCFCHSKQERDAITGPDERNDHPVARDAHRRCRCVDFLSFFERLRYGFPIPEKERGSDFQWRPCFIDAWKEPKDRTNEQEPSPCRQTLFGSGTP